MQQQEQLMVSVFMITYNHEKYIAQAIDGVLSQKVNFSIKLFIGDDCSKDNTRAIIAKYVESNPGLIELICTKENNIQTNAYNIFEATTKSGARYIAFCEGDDYWIDRYKLQKQIDFLEANPGFAISFTGVEIKDEMGWNLPDEHYTPEKGKDVFTVEDFILSYVSLIPTATMVIRNVLPDPVPRLCVAMSGDVATQILAASKGKAKYLPEKTAVYRNHSTGITKSQYVLEKSNEELVKMLLALNELLGFKYNDVFRKRLLLNSKVNLIYGAKDKKGIARLKHYFKRMPDYIKYSDKVNLRELAYYHAVLFFPSILRLFKKSENTI